MQCLSPKLEMQTPGFKELKSWYPEKDDMYLVQNLASYRKHMHKPDDWYPSQNDKGSFTRFMRYGLHNARKEEAATNLTEKDVLRIYDDMSNAYTRQELADRVNLLSTLFGSRVTNFIRKHQGSDREMTTGGAIRKMGGYGKIMANIFDSLHKSTYEDEVARLNTVYGEPRNEEEKAKRQALALKRTAAYQKMYEHRDRLAAIASKAIGEAYNLVVSYGGLEINVDDYKAKRDEEEDENENAAKGTKGERFIDTRTKMVYATLSTKVKNILASIPMTDNAGKAIRDDLGYVRNMDSRQVMNILLSSLKNTTADTFMDDMEDAADRYPFLRGLINKIDGKRNKADTDLQTSLFVNFKRATNVYIYMTVEDGKYHSDKANTSSHGNSLMRHAGTNMVSGFVLDDTYSIYSGNESTRGLIRDDIAEVSKKAKEALSIFDKLGYINTSASGRDNRSEYSKNQYEQLGGEEGIKSFLNNNPDAIKTLLSVLRGAGIDITADQLKNAASKKLNKKTSKIVGLTKQGKFEGTNRLMVIEDAILSIYDQAERIKKVGGTAEDLYKTAAHEFMILNSALGISLNDEVESRSLFGERTLATHISPNLLHEVLDDLNNVMGRSDEDYNQALNKNYIQYQGFNLRGEPVGWMKRLLAREDFSTDADGNYTVGPFRALNAAQINLGNRSIEYEDLSEPMKAAAQTVFFFEQDDAVEVPIESDYESAWDFVTNAGVGLSTKPEELKKLIDERYDAEAKKYEEEHGEGWSQEESKEALRAIEEEAVSTLGSLTDEAGNAAAHPVIDELTDEVLVEIDRIQRIAKELADDPNGIQTPRLKNRDTNGLKFQIFPEFNSNGFLENYSKIDDHDEALQFVRNNVAEQLQRVVDNGLNRLENLGVFKNPLMRSIKRRNTGWEVYLYDKEGKIDNLNVYSRLALQDMMLKYFSGRVQMTKVFGGGLENFGGILDYEKRSMMFHATRKGVYTKATWNGNPIGRENERVAYIVDEKTQSAFLDQIGNMIDSLEASKLVDSDLASRIKDAYKSITPSDGQGFRTYESYRISQMMQDKWSKEQEDAYQRLHSGKFTDADVRVVSNTVYNALQKPVYTGYEIVGDLRIPVLHKYSEIVLFPPEMIKRIAFQQNNAQVLGLSLAAEELSKQQGGFDMFLFTSNVKVGAHSAIDVFGYKKDEKGKLILDSNGNPIRKATTAEEVKNYVLQKVKENPMSVHTLPYKYYGEAASSPTHVEDEKIAWSSQAIKHVYGDIEPGDAIDVNGNKMSALQGRELFDAIEAASQAEAYVRIESDFNDYDKLSTVLKEELADKPYSSPELEFAITRMTDGETALPLYTPSINGGAQRLFHAMIRKRLTRRNVKGANIYQATSFGNDVDPFGVGFQLSNEDKPKLRFSKDGKFEGIECIVPITDSRLEAFTDANGNITPERLRQLVKEGTIPEEMLKFVAYRTPSDDIHSVLPMIIVGFSSKLTGANIVMPKEAMVMTGHDFDGDKMRCFFKDFYYEYDDEALRKKYDSLQSALQSKEGEARLVQYIFGQTNEIDLETTYEKFVENLKKGRYSAIDPNDYRKIAVYSFDYNASDSVTETALKNSQQARDNAKVELIFAQLTSDAGARRMFIAGGFEMTKVYAYTYAIIDQLKQNALAHMVLKKEGVSGKRGEIYSQLLKKDSDSLLSILNKTVGDVTPFTFEHSLDSFGYIMGGAKMIEIYALQGSAAKLMQKLNLAYVPVEVEDKKTGKQKQKIEILGCPINELFKVRNHDGQLSALTYGRLLNAAVDNGKSPVLGYLNQSPALAEVTFFLHGAGLSEEQIHLVLNQPVVKELVNRSKERGAGSFTSIANDLISELIGKDAKVFAKYAGTLSSAKHVAAMTKDDFIDGLFTDYSALENSEDEQEKGAQIALLRVLSNMYGAADDLSRLIKNTRPEASKAGIGTVVEEDIAKNYELNSLRDKIDDKTIRISGAEGVLTPRDIQEGDSAETILSKTTNEMRQVQVLQAVMQDRILPLMSRFFPGAKEDWSAIITDIASKYRGNSLNKRVIRDIINEMILWKLEQSASLVGGEIEERRRELLVNMPNRLWKLKYQIGKAQEQRNLGQKVDKPYLLPLAENTFLQHIQINRPESAESLPRVSFRSDGPVLEGMTESYRRDWAALAKSTDPDIRNLSRDLYLYNMFTNGFGFGMYEFAHFAPISVLYSVDDYVTALRDVMKGNFANRFEDLENFRAQYYQNHWGDRRLVPYINNKNIPNEMLNGAGMPIDDFSTLLKEQWKLNDIPEMISTSVDKVTTPYFVVEDNGYYYLEPAQKMGFRTKKQQVTVQYNPTLDYTLQTPLQTGFDSAWGTFGMEMVENSAPADIESAPNNEQAPIETITADDEKSAVEKAIWKTFGPRPQVGKTEEAAVPVVEENRKKLSEAGKTVPANLQPAETSGITTEQSTQEGELTGEYLAAAKKVFGKIVHRYTDANGNQQVKVESVPMTPKNIREMRKMQTFVDLNKRLRAILQDKGIGTGVITAFEERIGLAGITDFDTANVTAEGLLEMIRLANGYVGEQALPEEFAHLALDMLGYDHPLVKRLIAQLETSDAAMEEAFEGWYGEYKERYANNRDKLIKEAAGKLVAKQLFRQQQIESSPVRRLIARIIDAIKSLLRKIGIREVQDAIFDSNQIASQLARNLLSGRLTDAMDRSKVTSSGQFLKAQKNLTKREGIVNRILQTTVSKLALLKKRLGKGVTEKSSAMVATEREIEKLEKALKGQKTETAIIEYLSSTLDYMHDMEEKLDNTIDAGLGVNQICKELNEIRDTLTGYTGIIDDVRDSIRDNEIQDSPELQEAIKNTSYVVSQFFDKYNAIGMRYFEEMLSGIYGEHGITRTIGRNRGKNISIHDMARSLESDVSLASRYLSSVANSGDYVLMAMDDILRDAKVRGRKRTEEVQRRINTAIAKLEQATGSRDQSFMFQYERGEDGKMHKNGLYITEEQAKQLPTAKQEFYNEMMSIKKEVDQTVPASLVVEDRIVCLRKYGLDKIKSSPDVKSGAVALWDGVKNSVLDMSDDLEYDKEYISVDLQGNKIDMLPVKYLNKSKNESWDEMTDDVATSMLAYAGMGFEYNELNGVVPMLENARYMSMNRDVVQKTGFRTKVASFITGNDENDYAFEKPFTVKQARSNIQFMMDEWFQGNVYGKTEKAEGTFGKTRISKRKVANLLNRIASYSQMAFNLQQRIANVGTGLTNITIESAGKGIYNAKDVAWATGIYTKNGIDRLADTGKNESDNKLSLWAEYFDVHQDNGRKKPQYSKGRFSRVFNTGLLFAGLNIGEDYLALTTSLSVARNFKVKSPSGKVETLWDAYEVKYTDPGSKTGAHLELKKGYTKMDGSEITSEDERRFAKLVAGTNFRLQGIYNYDDRSAIQRSAFGSLVIMYRKWIYPAIQRRYGKAGYNLLLNQEVEGYYRTAFNLLGESMDDVRGDQSYAVLLNIFKYGADMLKSLKLNYSKLTDYEKTNITRAFTEFGILMGTSLGIMLLGKLPPEKDDENKALSWLDNQILYHMYRIRNEVGSVTPTPMAIKEGLNILNSPFAAIRPLQSFVQGFGLLYLPNYYTEVKSGMYKGHSRAYKYFWNLPVLSMYKQVQHVKDPTSLINYYKNGSY